MTDPVFIALIASLPGLLAAGAAYLSARRRLTREDVVALREELREARAEIAELKTRVDQCDEERRTLMRENIELYRRVDSLSAT